MTDIGLSPSFAHPRPARRSSLSSRISPVKQLQTVLQTVDNQVYLLSLIDKYYSPNIVRELLTAEYSLPTPTSKSMVVDFEASETKASVLEKPPVAAAGRSVSPNKKARINNGENSSESLSHRLGGRETRSAMTSSSSDELPLRRNGPVGTLHRTSMRLPLSTRSPGSVARAAPKRSRH